MMRVNKVSEYGILALGYIGGQVKAVSARQVSEGLQIPYEITAKTLQKLKDAGFVNSTKGTNGGYILVSPLSQISFAQIVDAIEGPIGITECMSDGPQAKICSRHESCELKSGMKKVNQRVRELLESVKLDELTNKVETRIK